MFSIFFAFFFFTTTTLPLSSLFLPGVGGKDFFLFTSCFLEELSSSEKGEGRKANKKPNQLLLFGILRGEQQSVPWIDLLFLRSQPFYLFFFFLLFLFAPISFFVFVFYFTVSLCALGGPSEIFINHHLDTVI